MNNDEEQEEDEDDRGRGRKTLAAAASVVYNSRSADSFEAERAKDVFVTLMRATASYCSSCGRASRGNTTQKRRRILKCRSLPAIISIQPPQWQPQQFVETNMVEDTEDCGTVQIQRRGYFYESVGGVYYTLEWPLKSSPSSSADHNGIAITNGNEDDNVSSQEKEKNGKF